MLNKSRFKLAFGEGNITEAQSAGQAPSQAIAQEVKRNAPRVIKMLAPQIDQHAQQLADTKPAIDLLAKRTQTPATLVEIDEHNPAFRRLVLAHRDSTFSARFTHPGQYTTLTYGTLNPRFLVIASAPTEFEHRWEFLISRDSTLGKTITPDDTSPILVSQPEGRGFAHTLWSGQHPTLLFCSGSGFATMRTLLMHMALHTPDQLGQTTLYFGLNHPQQIPYTTLINHWRETYGLEVHYAFDHSEDGPRFVQHAFEANPKPLLSTHVALSGAPIMIRETAKYLMRQGLPFDRLHLNI